MKKFLSLFFSMACLFSAEFHLQDSIDSCENGDGNACRSVALHYTNIAIESKYSNTKAMELGVAYNLKACELKVGVACYTIHGEYSDSGGWKKILPPDKEKALEYLIKSCEYNYADGCHSLAHYYSKQARSEAQKAKQFYKKACDLGDKVSCGYK